MALALSGCSSFESGSGWFAKPMDFFGRGGGYTFSDIGGGARREQVITASDLVDANGACPGLSVQPAPGGAETSPQPDSSSLLGGAVGLGMSECDVVRRAGQPASVEIGQNPGAVRTALMTFKSGPRPGLYRFEGGKLIDVEAVELPPPPAAAKAKPAKAKKPPKKDDAA
jgi:hypothetical protein